MTWLLVALGAGVGAPLRLVCAHHLDEEWPLGTLAVNAVGSFLLGLFSLLALDGRLLAVVGAGFCGALTTYSAFAIQTHDLGGRRGAAYAAGSVLAALGAVGLGVWVGGLAA